MCLSIHLETTLDRLFLTETILRNQQSFAFALYPHLWYICDLRQKHRCLSCTHGNRSMWRMQAVQRIPFYSVVPTGLSSIPLFHILGPIASSWSVFDFEARRSGYMK